MKELARDDAPERMSLSDFLAWEEAQTLRHERVGGSVWAMTGGTLAHNRIGLNVFSAFRTRLAGSGCEAFAFDVRVVSPGGDVMYPDVVVACGERRDTDKEVGDPVLVVEVLSDKHGCERWAYGTIPSLKHYVLIAPDRAEAEVATVEGEAWRSVVLRDVAASLPLDALGLEIPMAELLAGVDITGDSQVNRSRWADVG